MYSCELNISLFLDNQPFGELSHKFDIPFIPQKGMNIAFGVDVAKLKGDALKKRYESFFREVSNPTGIFAITGVTYYVAPRTGGAMLAIDASPVVEKEEKKMDAYVQLMTEFYEFEFEPAY